MKIKKLLVANRGEIAIRIFRAAVELDIRTVAIHTYEDRYSQHSFKADESYQIGEDNNPLKPYLDIDMIINLAKEKGVDAIHPGYGFLSENSKFAQACVDNGIIFIGPTSQSMEFLGDKIKAKSIANKCGIPIIESNCSEIKNIEMSIKEAEKIGYPIMLKAASGGGGRGMRIVRNEDELKKIYTEAKRESLNAFGDDTLFLEKFVDNPKHIEIQIVADNYGNIVHLYERDCSVQRRYQKVIEMAPSYKIDSDIKNKLYKYAIDICRAINYNNIGTVEFLLDKKNNIYFIEVNPRIQVEHTITEIITGIDLVKTQIHIASGYKLDSEQIKIKSQESINKNGYAIQARITTEDPNNNFTPDYGIITTYRSAAGFGIRLDVGSIYQGSKISPFFDSMLVKVSSHSRDLIGACKKMKRALEEFRIRGVKTNIPFLLNIVQNEQFRQGKSTVNFVQETQELFDIPIRRDRASKIVYYLADVTVNGNPDIRYVDKSKKIVPAKVPNFDRNQDFPKGTKDKLNQLGVDDFCKWLKHENKIHYTDTTMRDAHQSLLATRIRTYDMLKVAEGYAKTNSNVFSLEVWGGATFDVSLRFLNEDPWQRLKKLRKAIPNILFQMLLRGSNAVGYSAYPNNLIQKFIQVSWENGVDIFRVFDALNWRDSIIPSISYIRKNTKAIAEAAICYTGDILDKNKTKYDLKYYLDLAKNLENEGAHMLAIKDMAGLLKPYAATELITALKDTIQIPIHLHTHDTSSLQTATYMKAIESGVDIIDVALGGLSGLTSQPSFNSILEMMKFHRRENEMNIENLNAYSNYWETIREHYYPFESGLKSPTAEVYKHEIPGGQYSNLKSQSIALGLIGKFEKIKKMYADVNLLFGDLIKVTPSSKVVGDMAQFLISNDLDVKDVLCKGDTLSFPESVKSLFRGDLGQPMGGFSKKLQKIILKDEKPYKEHPNSHFPDLDIEADFQSFTEQYEKCFHRELRIEDYLSYKLYPKEYNDAYKKYLIYGDVSNIPTKNFFFGMEEREEIIVNIAEGKSLIIQLLSIGTPNEMGMRTIFFKVNGQTRNVIIQDQSLDIVKKENPKIQYRNKKHIGAPIQGLLSKFFVKENDQVDKNKPLFVIEAMKMETTIGATEKCVIDKIYLVAGTFVNIDDLILGLK